MTTLVHCWSSDMGPALSLPFLEPLLARGWQIVVACPPGPRLAEIEALGVRVIAHELERRFHPAGDLRGARTLYRAFRGLRPDIVHTHNAKVGLVARAMAAAARVPIIVHTHHGLVFSLDTP